uniref:Endoplasmic reticulum-Golgi intermediate compartment protein n=1 Tax=Oncorhynchus mykiss TaxID=8022 RepID=A0A8C7PU37_ONCMY
MFQYFITVVPTKLHTSKVSADKHQFSVTERVTTVSGIFMKYDTSSLMVTVSEQHMPLWQFLVRLCGIIGGIFSTTVCCRFKLGPYKPREVSPVFFIATETMSQNDGKSFHVPGSLCLTGSSVFTLYL